MLSDSRKKELIKLLKKLNISSNNFELIDNALTHPSYTFENSLSSLESYERLEFLGDAVLKLAVSKILYQKYPDSAEGQLTKIRGIIVSDDFLSKLAIEINLDKYINLGVQEEKMGGRTRSSILACAFEALLGAFFLDEKMNGIYALLEKLYEPHIDDIVSNICIYNAKALLQEYTQEMNKDLPEYRIIKETGRDHNKEYQVEVSYNGKVLGVGKGKSKKEAEKDAALQASIKLKLIIGGKCQR